MMEILDPINNWFDGLYDGITIKRMLFSIFVTLVVIYCFLAYTLKPILLDIAGTLRVIEFRLDKD